MMGSLSLHVPKGSFTITRVLEPYNKRQWPRRLTSTRWVSKRVSCYRNDMLTPSSVHINSEWNAYMHSMRRMHVSSICRALQSSNDLASTNAPTKEDVWGGHKMIGRRRAAGIHSPLQYPNSNNWIPCATTLDTSTNWLDKFYDVHAGPADMVLFPCRYESLLGCSLAVYPFNC